MPTSESEQKSMSMYYILCLLETVKNGCANTATLNNKLMCFLKLLLSFKTTAA